MHRWFFADELEVCDKPQPPPAEEKAAETPIPEIIPEEKWKFCVSTENQLKGNEHVVLVGNINVLGGWKMTKGIVMTNVECTRSWCTTVSISRKDPVQYRYFICAIDPSNSQIIVRRWETHRHPRVLPNAEVLETKDIFGEVDEIVKVDRGWLTSEVIVQLRFFNEPFTYYKALERRLQQVRVTPMDLNIPSEIDEGILPAESPIVDCMSEATLKGNEPALSTAFAFNEVAVLQAGQSTFHYQPSFGTPCGPKDLVLFQMTISELKRTTFLIDLYTATSKHPDDELPFHFGYHYLMPNTLGSSDGVLEVPITCASKHRIIGMMRIGYLIIRPFAPLRCDMSVSYTRHWNKKWTGLDIGHRGCGASFKETPTCLRENTIASLKHAEKCGVDMVEFDVHLSKDLVPVVYHDFLVYVSMKSAKHCAEAKTAKDEDYFPVPLSALTFNELKNFTVLQRAEQKWRDENCNLSPEDIENRPFPPLADLFEALGEKVAFNIEFKWMQQRQKRSRLEKELRNEVDRNLYVDSMLKVVFEKAGERRIVFSSFDPDICTMLRFKQNRYPVMFVTLGSSKSCVKFMDPRGHNMHNAVHMVLANEMLGIVAHSEDLLAEPDQIKMALINDLVLFCWGDDNNTLDSAVALKQMGLTGIIHDKIDVFSNKQHSIFLLESLSAKELLRLQSIDFNAKWNKSPSILDKSICCNITAKDPTDITSSDECKPKKTDDGVGDPLLPCPPSPIPPKKVNSPKRIENRDCCRNKDGRIPKGKCKKVTTHADPDENKKCSKKGK